MSTTLWLEEGVHAELHAADLRRAEGVWGVGVVMVAPFGWEDQASHRLRRVWADRLATAGAPTLRLDLPGAGDSADPSDPDVDLLPAWTAAVSAACVAMRACTDRVALLGLGLGGIPAFRAFASGDGDDLALWATPAKGRMAVRELTAFARMQATADPSPDGALWANGFRVSAATMAALSAVDLTSEQLVSQPADAGPRRVLLLGRDAAPADERLATALRDQGAEVELAEGAGWTVLVGHPMTGVLPEPVVLRVRQWLDGAPRTARRTDAEQAAGTDRTRLPTGVVEQTLRLQTPSGELFAVVSQPDPPVVSVNSGDGRTFVLLNAGALPHTGPNRLWVRAARAAAAAGVTAVRLDLPGIGDSPATGEGTVTDADFYTPQRTEQVSQALDALVAQGLPGRFVLAGLCSGAYWSFELGRDDPRVEQVLLLNPMALLWHQAIAGAHLAPDLRRQLRWASWRRLLTGQTTLRGSGALARELMHHAAAVPGAVRARRAAARSSLRDPLLASFDLLREHGTVATLAFSDDEPLLRELRAGGQLDQLARHDGVDLRLLGGPVDSHTLAPEPLQRAALVLFATALLPGPREPQDDSPRPVASAT